MFEPALVHLISKHLHWEKFFIHPLHVKNIGPNIWNL